MDTRSIVKLIIEELKTLPRDREYSTYELIKIVLGKDSPDDDVILNDVHYMLMDVLPIYGLKMDFTDDSIIGVPYNLPYMISPKRKKKNK